MTGGACAPARLPFAPKPLKMELFSSWLLRVAAANHVSARELLNGFSCLHQGIALPISLDSCLDLAFLRAVSRFCRVPIRSLQGLDLQARLQPTQHALLLRFGAVPRSCPRHCDLRVGYAFCPLCIAHQNIVHVRWDWSLACLIRCAVHGTPLQLGCHVCRERDPLSFGPTVALPIRACRSCGADLARGTGAPCGPRSSEIAAVERAYRDALLGVAPSTTVVDR